MDLQDLGLSENQIKALEKKKVASVEALLRKPPLHYYDFTKFYELDTENASTMEMLNKNRPFAITGVCTHYSKDFSDHSVMVKMRIMEKTSKATLFVNVIGYDMFRQAFLDSMDDSPHKMDISVPPGIPLFYEGVKRDVKPSCLKQIEYMNSLDERSSRDFISIKTGGSDAWSKAAVEDIADAETAGYVSEFFDFPGNTVNALRWYARGLRLDLAIKKVLLDDDTLIRGMVFNKTVTVGGFIEYNEEYRTFSVLNPPFFRLGGMGEYFVQYGQIKGLTPESYQRYVDSGINSVSSIDFIPHDFCDFFDIPGFKASARMMHHPSSYRDVVKSGERAVTEDLLYLALKMGIKNKRGKGIPGVRMGSHKIIGEYASSLPYSLTSDQKNAVNAVYKHMVRGERTNALIQGDVGTGKTAVAICLMLVAADNGYQAALAAPYTTLASQHYRDIKETAEAFGIKTAFLSSDVTGKDRKKALELISSGEAQLIVGTHSIFSKDVEYKNLALIIEDEEHKFGVVHRDSFSGKALPGAHHVTMSATPIPKSVASTIYDDMTEIITIKEMPSGRVPVQTAVCRYDKTAMDFMKKEVSSGRQCYVVCPSIESGDKDGKKESIEEKEKVYRAFFDPLGIKMEILTGKTKPSDRQRIMEGFSSGEISILMATTVIEVGINVPNASVMVITGADRFGFSTLHQLRGRVGRGQHKSYCILQTESGNEKLNFLCDTLDGFKIAEKDLELRGPGSLFGERQSGDNYYISLMLQHAELYKRIKPWAMKYLEDQTGADIIRRYEEIFRSEEER